MRNFKFIVVLVILLSYAFTLAPIVLNDDKNEYNVPLNSEIYIDKTSKVTFSEIKSGLFDNSFFVDKRKIPVFGYAKDVIWVKFKLNDQSVKNKWLLSYDYEVIDNVIFFIPQINGSYKKHYGGDLVPFRKREIKYRKNLVFLDNVDYSKYLYIRVESEGILKVDVSIYSLKRFIEKDHVVEFLYGLFLGGFCIMILYYFFLYVTLRNKVYLYFTLFIAFLTLNQFAYYGLAYEFFWPDFTSLNSHMMPITGTFTGIFACLFAGSFLNTKRLFKKINRIFVVFILGHLLFFLMDILFIPYVIAMKYSQVLVMLDSILIIIVALIIYKKKYAPAKNFLIAWFLFLSSMIVFVLSNLRMLPKNMITEYSYQIGSMLLVVLLALSLVEYINELRKEEQKAREEAEHVKKEEAVTVQQEKMSILGDITASVAHEINTPLLALTLGNNKLKKYVDKMRDETALPETLEADERFMRSHNKYEKNMGSITNGLNTIRQQIINMKAFIKFQDTTTDFDLNDEIETTFSIMNFTLLSYMDVEKDLAENLPRISGNASQINQLFMNMMKNASEAKKEGNEKGFLKFKTYSKVDKVILEITDKGVGINEDDISKIYDDRFSTKSGHRGMGLSISKDLMKQLNGEIAVQSKVGEGTIFTIILPAMKTEAKEV